MSSEIYAVAKCMPSAKFMTLTLTLTLIYDPNPNPNPIPCEILDAFADSPIVIHFASGEFRATPEHLKSFFPKRVENPLLMKIEFLTSLYRIALELVIE